MRPILWYITAHGYGHGVRSADIMRALLRLEPELPLVVSTTLPPTLLTSRLGGGRLRFRERALDAGLVQHDSVRIDLEASLAQVERLMAETPKLLEQERRVLREHDAALVVADIPGLPLAAARADGLPAVAVGNFGWDWIYAALAEQEPRWRPAAEQFQEQYTQAELLLRLPFSEPMSAFRRRVDLPVVAEPGCERRRQLAALTGADPARPWALLSFTSLGWSQRTLERVAREREFELLSVLPLDLRPAGVRAVDRLQVPYADVLASCDVVVSKPGFGVLSDCVVNDRPLVWAEREHFAEYPLLVAALRRHLRQVHLPSEALYRGDLAASIAAALKAPAAPEHCPVGGAPIAARRLLELWRSAA